jgi:hypothetical protein
VKSFSILILVIFLTGCEFPLVADRLAVSGGTLYYDDFSDKSTGWPRTSNAYGKMDYDENGTYRIMVNSPDYNMWAVLDQVFQDARIEVDATPLAALEVNRYGEICRYQSPQEFYFFVITADGYFSIGKVKDNIQTLLGQDMMSYSKAIRSGSTMNHLRFDCIGQALTGYVNDQAIAFAHDAEFTAGKTGLIAGTFDQPEVDVSFDNFMVYKP